MRGYCLPRNKTTFKRATIAASLCVLSPFLTMCSNHEDNVPQPSPSSVSPSLSQTSEPIAAPDIKGNDRDYVTVTANPQAAKKLEKVGSEAQDQWFIQTIRDSGYNSDEGSLLKLRDDVCRMISQKTTFRNISDNLSDRGLDEKEQGVVISSSLTSKCYKNSLKIKKDLLEKQTSQTLKD